MKKKTLVKLFLIAILLCVGIIAFLNSDFSYLAVARGTITSSKNTDSVSSFHVANNTLSVSCDSTVEEGTLEITLIDSAGTVIQDFDVNKTYSVQVAVKKNAEYKIFVSYKDFIGTYEVKCK